MWPGGFPCRTRGGEVRLNPHSLFRLYSPVLAELPASIPGWFLCFLPVCFFSCALLVSLSPPRHAQQAGVPQGMSLGHLAQLPLRGTDVARSLLGCCDLPRERGLGGKVCQGSLAGVWPLDKPQQGGCKCSALNDFSSAISALLVRPSQASSGTERQKRRVAIPQRFLYCPAAL